MSDPAPTPDDLLARAEDAVRRAPVPEGPSPEAVARILDAARTAAGRQAARPVSRPARRWLVRAAAAVVVGALSYAAGSHFLQPPLAFADVARQLREARTFTYRVTSSYPDGRQSMSARFLFREPGLIRTEDPGGQVAIIDVNAGKSLLLDPRTRTALLVEGLGGEGRPDPDDVNPAQMVERLRALAEKEGRPAGQKEIGGVRAQGFRVEDRGQEWTVWADPATRRPVRIEATLRVGNLEVRVALSDFVLNPVLDESLFRLEPPAGYTLRKVETEHQSPEAAVARLLRAYADRSGGTFPPRLDDWAAYEKAFKDWKNRDPFDPDQVRLVQTMIRVVRFVTEHPKDYGYEAAGVKVGDGGRIVFWYRPAGANTYRVVDGALRVREVTADRIPGKAKP